MQKVMFQGEECYVAYKGLKNKLTNYQDNYTYEPNNWYKTLDVDMSDVSCSYGINLCKTKEAALEFGYRIFKWYVPINNNRIKFSENQDKFRCLRAYMAEEIKYNWDELTEYQKEFVCKYNPNFDYEKYWDELTEYQKEFVCYNPSFDYNKYWDELTEYQKNYKLCMYR